MSRFISYTFVFAMIAVLFSCTKDPVIPAEAEVTFSIHHHVSQGNIEFDDIRFENQAENAYSITRMEYYLSDFQFKAKDGITHSFDEVFLINARESASHSLVFPEVPTGEFMGLSFLIGLPAHQNLTGALPNESRHNNMSWPDPMGGGYHFLKLEGHFIDDSLSLGYALHIGKTPNSSEITFDTPFEVAASGNLLNLSMDINEWFANPHLINLSDESYSMGNAQFMEKLAANGKTVFTFSK